MAGGKVKEGQAVGPIGVFVLRFRAPIGILLLLFSAFMGYQCTRVKIATDFDEFFPRYHQNVQLYEKWKKYGGAQRLVVMVQVKNGDIFNFNTLSKIQGIQRDVDKLPGVDHNEVFSLASYRVSYAEAAPGSLTIKPFMFPDVPKEQAGIEELKRHVFSNRARISQLISADNKSALVTASFNERGLDYRELFDDVQNIVKKYQDANNEIFVAGEPVVRGYGYYYEHLIDLLFLLAVATMIVILYVTLGQRTRWWAPIVTGTLSAIWGLGFVGLMQYNFDPVMLVIPFILTARDMSHGIQWQGRFHDELDRLGDKYAACEATTDFMLPPGLLSILADIAGIIFISFGGIPVLQHIALAGSVWLAGSLTMVFIFQPIFVSYLPAPKIKEKKKRAGAEPGWLRAAKDFVNWLVHIPVTPGPARTGLIVFALCFLAAGIIASIRQDIGYKTPGTPLYRPDAKVNRDIVAIGKKFPLEEGWVILTTPSGGMAGTASAAGAEQSVLAPRVLRMVDDMRAFLMEDPRVRQVVSFSSTISYPFNQMFHYGYPKFLADPDTMQLSGNLWFLYLNGSAPGELEQYISNRSNDDTCIRVFLADHTYDTLNGIRDRIKRFVEERVSPDPGLNKVHVWYLAGLAGLYQAANDVLYELDFLNITFVLGVVFIFCVISFRSFVAGLMFLFSCVLANFGAFIYMGIRGIGLTIDTIPVISLGIGLGVDYGIYTVSRIRDEVMGGMAVEEAIVLALKTTGLAVFSTFMVMIGGIFPWIFSPLLFHNEMSTLLIFLMACNMVAGVLVLPCYIQIARPRFVFGGAQAAKPENGLKGAAAAS
ncbi:MAG TPA: MMPL family transporter [Candidatus Binataceae bacterium]|jgi:predicted RND superfamily exporter protein|nr:MMPL family transporter [Candidatus Binataceae bacterium]